MNKSFNQSRFLGALFMLLLALGLATAQEFRATVTGTIKDPNEAVIPGANVTITNVETNVSASATTNDEGVYTFPLLQPGKYKLTATAPNFQTSVREEIQLNIDDRLTLDVQLTVGAAAEVNISADTEIIERGTVSTGTVITERQITELPLSEGAAYNLATQAPGVSYTGNPQFTGPTANGNLAAIRTNGAPGNQITLDGSPNLAFDGGVAYTPPADALSQFKIQTNAFDAQNGFTAGSTVNVAVKSGTNDLHGSLYYFNRPGVLTANNFFSNRAGQERPPRSYYRAGGQVNGPVYIPYLYNGRDKTFFMFSYEKQLDERAEPETFTVPTTLMRTGNFSELLPLGIQIFDPASAFLGNATCGTTGTLNNVCRTPFAGNIIPQNRLNQAAVRFLNLYPLPNVPGVSNGTFDNYFSNQVLNRPYDSYLTRIDHNFNQNHRIFGKFFYSKSNEDRLNFINEPDSVTQGFEIRQNKGGNLDYTATLSNYLVLDIRSSLNDFVQERIQANPISAADLGFNPSANNGLTFLANINNPFPTGLNPVTGSSLGLRTALGTTLGTTNATGPTETVVYSYDRKNANYTRFIAGIQRELPFDIGVEATFVMSRGNDLPVLRQLNYIPREYLIDLSGITDAATINARITANNAGFLNQNVPNPLRGLIPGGGTFNNATIQRRFLLTQFPQFQDLIVTEYNGSNDYRSLQLQANKRLSSGFSFNASYTYAHEREKTRRLNPQDEELTSQISTFSRPHRITFSSVAELPFGRGRQFFSEWNPVVDAFLGGWQFNAVYEWQSGEPLLLQNNFFNGDPSQLRNRLGETDEQGRKYGVDIPAFDTSLFRTTDTGAFIAFGNNYTVSSQNVLRTLPLTLNNLRMQPFQKFDVGLTKNFRINERMKLQVRVEAINALNKVYFNVPQLASNNAAFGLTGGQRNLPRDIQIGGRFTF